MVVRWVDLVYARALPEVGNANGGILIGTWGWVGAVTAQVVAQGLVELFELSAGEVAHAVKQAEK